MTRIQQHRAACKRYYLKNRREILSKNAIYQKLHPGKVCERVKAYQRRHPARVKAARDKYLKENVEKRRETVRKVTAKYLKNNVQARLKHLLRNGLLQALKGKAKSGRTVDLLGCSFPDFKIYIESRFKIGMTWENQGRVWHIDHIMPCAIFDLTKPEHQRRCFHFSNQQPMWSVKNSAKHRRVITNQFNLL